MPKQISYQAFMAGRSAMGYKEITKKKKKKKKKRASAATSMKKKVKAKSNQNCQRENQSRITQFRPGNGDIG